VEKGRKKEERGRGRKVRKRLSAYHSLWKKKFLLLNFLFLRDNKMFIRPGMFGEWGKEE
jgi:hypothetical protein